MPITALTFRLGYRPELDGIRALAVVSVMLCHTFVIGRGADFLLPGALPAVMTGGVFGVDMFFVLSGFLITSLLVQEHSSTGRIAFKLFYLRRVLRLAPAMALLLLASVIYIMFFRPSGSNFDLEAVLMSMLYVSNFALIFAGLRLGMLTQTWSLSVEEQFYSLWPVSLSLLLRMKRSRVALFIALAAASCFLVRAGLYSAYLMTGKVPLFGAANHLLFARADGLMLGALVALAAAWGWIPLFSNARIWPVLSWASLLALIAILCVGPMDYRPSVFYCLYLLTSVLSAIVIAGLIASQGSLNAALRLPPLVWIGKISYGLYLLHVPVYTLMPNIAPSFLPKAAEAWLTAGVAVLISFGLAAASYYLVELRFLNLKHRLSDSRHTSAHAGPSNKTALAAGLAAT